MHQRAYFLSTPATLLVLLLAAHGTAAAADAGNRQDPPDSAGEFQRRGVDHFSRGRFAKAVQDFDRANALDPRFQARNWQRGIACYYAGDYAEGMRQFELHRTVNPNDVENAAWHFLCKAKVDGIHAARQALIPIRGDSRIPMREIWRLYAGLGTEEEVLEAAGGLRPGGYNNRQALCYAHLYLGLYHEALENTARARKHLLLAAGEYSMDNYMGMVAQVHPMLKQ